jgi:single-strand selective monofunctional uracil DNA glycosylase
MAVRDWLGIDGAVGRPATEHPRRIVQGFDCPRSEVSGQRLWGLFAKQFGDSKSFFEEHFVLNYCPLAFLEKSGRNVTPDKLLPVERLALFQRCDEHLASAVTALNPEWLVGIGDFALKRAEQLFGENGPKLGRILHPSPASPAANRDWSGVATRQLKAQGVWR